MSINAGTQSFNLLLLVVAPARCLFFLLHGVLQHGCFGVFLILSPGAVHCPGAHICKQPSVIGRLPSTIPAESLVGQRSVDNHQT